MKIRIERSGGIAGIVTSHEISAENMPTSMKNKLHKVLQNVGVQSKATLPKRAADLFNYKIIFEDGSNNKIIERNQITMEKDLKDIVRYVEANTNKT